MVRETVKLKKEALGSLFTSRRTSHLTNGHELWVMTDRMRLKIQAVEMSIFSRLVVRTLLQKVRSSVIWKSRYSSTFTEGVGVVWASDLVEHSAPPVGGLPGTANWDGPQRLSQDQLEGL